MKWSSWIFAASLALTLAVACDQPTTAVTTTSTTTTVGVPSRLSLTMNSSSSTQIQEIANSVTTISLAVDVGATAHTLYLAFTNPSVATDATKPRVSAKVSTEESEDEAQSQTNQGPGHLRDLPLQASLPKPAVPARPPLSLSRTLSQTTTAAASIYRVGDTRTYRYFTYDNDLVSKTATLATQVSNATQNRILNIWTLGSDVTTTMAQAMADRFLASTGSGSDIYSWNTGVFGREYDEPGTSVGTGLISPTGEIDIVLADLNPNRKRQSSFVYGYYYSANNYTSVRSGTTELSNARLAFFLDAPVFATASGSSWEISDAGPADIVSTLAHEFQHMIHYYQKQLVHSLSNDTDTWVNEMCSLIAEDLVADKLAIAGPRGVPLASDGTFDYTSGTLASNEKNNRLGLFNSVYPKYSLTYWQDSVYDYSMAYSFGSWLVRNYGGPALFRAIVQNDSTDFDAVLKAINLVTGKTETVRSLLRHWAGAVLASDTATDTYALVNRQGTTETAFPFTQTSAVTETAQTFNLGSLNYFKYYAYGASTPTIGPVMATSLSSVTKILRSGLNFYKYPSTFTGSHTFTITIPANVDVTVVTKVTS